MRNRGVVVGIMLLALAVPLVLSAQDKAKALWSFDEVKDRKTRDTIGG